MYMQKRGTELKKIFAGTLILVLLAITLGTLYQNRLSLRKNNGIEENNNSLENNNRDDQYSVVQIMEKALLGEYPICYSYVGSTIHLETTYLTNITKNDSVEGELPQFAIIDLDKDSIPEVVFQLPDFSRYIILRYNNGDVLGYEIPYRGLQNLKSDGTFRTSNGSSDGTISRLHFWGNFYDYEILVSYSEQLANSNQDSIWTIREPTLVESLLNQDEFKIYLNRFFSKPEVEWHIYSNDSVKEWLPQEFTAYSDPDSSDFSRLQVFFDDLSGLKYDLQLEYYIAYSDGIDNAMKEVLEACFSALSADEVSALKEEYCLWTERRDQMLAEYSDTDKRFYVKGEITKQWMYFLISNYLNNT